MKKQFLTIIAIFFSLVFYGQAGHIMQGSGATNMSMGGASTAQPLDINGALLWNPAAISSFDNSILSISAGAFFSSPELRSSLPAGALGENAPAVSGLTEDSRGTSLMPALAYVWAKEDYKHTFGLSAFGISGFGVKFEEESNSPLSATFNPTENSNPINYPQQARGFGHIESDYILLQIGLSYAYEITEQLSIGIQPNINYATLELAPNPIALPGLNSGYPNADKASAIGIGGQVGVFYDSGKTLKLGAAYKTKQNFSEFIFDQTYQDGSESPQAKFTMNYPSILSFGLGLTFDKVDFAADVRFVDYENTEGFAEKGWTIAKEGDFAGFPTGSVKGFGWENMTIVSLGVQYQLTENMPIRLGYTYNTSPIQDELAFFSTPATAVITSAAQVGLGYKISDNMTINALAHYGFRGDGVSGTLLNPTPDVAGGPWNAETNPLGIMPGTSVSYDMSTFMLQFTLDYAL